MSRPPGRGSPSPGLGSSRPSASAVDAFWQGLLEPQPEGERRVHDLRPAPLLRQPQGSAPDRPLHPIRAGRRRRGAATRPGDVGGDPGRVGVVVGTGVGGLAPSRRTCTLDHEGAPPGVAVPGPDDDVQRGRGGHLDALRLAGPLRDHRHRVCHRHPVPSATPPASSSGVCATWWWPDRARPP